MKIWYQRFIWLLVAFSIQRILFLLLNSSAFADVSFLSIAEAFAAGLRFDICIIATINGPLFLFHCLRFSSVYLPVLYQRRFTKWIDHSVGLFFVFANVPLIIFGIVDSRLFAFTGRRISPETFDIGGDIRGQALGILLQYWYMTLPGLIAIFLFASINWQKDHSASKLEFDRKFLTFCFLFLAITSIAIRGGFQTKPLAPAHAYHWQPATLSNLVLNSGMTFLRSPPASQISRYKDFSTRADIANLLSANSEKFETLPLAEGRNFVVVVVESLATEYVGFLNNGKGYTPFLDELSKDSVFFEFSFANGRRSIDAIPAIFAGIPAWRDEPFITSPFAGNTIHAIPTTLKSLGYYSLFFHGAANGSMHFDSFASLAGFNEYIGKNEYPYKNDDDGQWGIYDEPFLRFTTEKLSKINEPFFAGIFTLSSHNPFKIPSTFTDKFPKGSLPIHESIGYVDYSLRMFFESASKTSWFRNTIFIITGDHTSLSDVPDYNNMPGRFRVPIIFYDPSGRLPKVESSKVASHIDIAPTIFELAGATSQTHGMFGGPLFAREWTGRFFQHEFDTWLYFDGQIHTRLMASNQTDFFDKNDPLWLHPKSQVETPNSERNINTIKAARQYYMNGLLDNNWYSEP